mgnify:FL=1
MAKPPFDLEPRTLDFARNVRAFLKEIPQTEANSNDRRQAARSSGSVGANYREANDALGKADLLMRLRIARKEAKETSFWLQLVDVGPNESLHTARDRLVDESEQLVRILSTIISRVMAPRRE